MTRTIHGHDVDATLIIDDQELARESYEDTITDAGLTPFSELGPLGGDIDAYYHSVSAGPATAVLCDQMLRHRNYAQFDGAEFVARCYGNGLPAVLCTDYTELVDDIRPWRRWIPSLQHPERMGADEFVEGLEAWLYEHRVGFRPYRRPWRTLVRVVDVLADERRFLAEVPAWGPTVIPVKYLKVPDEVLARITPDFRCRAHVNLGAESLEELFLCDWELVS